MSRSCCEERQQLEKEFWVAMHNHLLCEEAAKAKTTESARASQEEERAKEGRDLARRALEQHQSEHGC